MLAMGTNLVAVAGLGNRLSLLFYLPATAVGSAAVTLIAGNNDYKERKQLIKQLCVTSVLPTIVIIIVAFFVRGAAFANVNCGCCNAAGWKSILDN